MKERKRIVSAIFLIIVMLLSVVIMPAEAVEKNTSNRFNVCFVLDSTNSLLDTDAEKLRYDATSMFLGLLANDGNYVGSVIFSGGVIKTTDVTPINGPEDKIKAEKDLETNEQLGATTIGAALDQAIDMLLSKGDSSLDSVVILLSDGQSNKQDEKEMNSRSEALTKAKKNSIPVYTVALNADGEADLDVLEQIANATDGKYKEVKKADDLKDVFREFYNMIYSAGTIKIMDGVIPEDGKISVPFEVPYQGVEEVNIIISSDNRIENLTLTEPNGKELDEEEVAGITTVAKRFTITKITKPIGGKWKLEGKGTPGSNIKIDMVYNDSITIQTEYKEKDKYSVSDTVSVSGYILDNGEKITSGYEDYKAKLIPDNNKGKEIPMKISNNSFVGDISFDQEGTYTYHMELEGNGLKKYTETASIKLNVGNFAPVISDEGKDINEHFWVVPFFTKTCEVNLSKAVSDPDGDKLSFDVASSTFKNSTYEIKDDKLVIKDFYDLSKGVCTIRAMDPKGSYVEFDVTVSLTNVGIVTLIVVGSALLIILILAFLKLRHDLLLKFSGTISIDSFGDASVVTSTITPIRGRLKLSAFGVAIPGIDTRKCYFQATGKNFIYFVSKKKVYSSGVLTKKVKIDGSGYQVTISPTADMENGIYVSFETMLNVY